MCICTEEAPESSPPSLVTTEKGAVSGPISEKVDDTVTESKSKSSGVSVLSGFGSHDATLFAIAVAAFAYLRRYRITIRIDEVIPAESKAADGGEAGGMTFLTLLFVAVVLCLTTSRRLHRYVMDFVRSPSSSTSQPQPKMPRATSREAFRQAARKIRRSITSYKTRSALQALSSKECFLRLDRIQELSATDVSSLFAFICGDKNAIFGQRGLEDVVKAMDLAVSVSRGSIGAENTPDAPQHRSSTEATPSSSSVKSFDDVDALQFVAVARISSEWRAARLFPRGGRRYRRYEAALALAHRDALQNLAKIERAVHGYLKYHKERSPPETTQMATPTLHQLLTFESERGVHPRLPRLTENSAANGLLWTIRQLQYQQASFVNLLRIPDDFPSFKEAGLAAYEQVYEPYHGWAVRQMFRQSFGGSPPTHVIWSAIQSPTPVVDAMDSVPPPARKLSESSEVLSDSVKEMEKNEFLDAMDQFGKHVAYEWEKFLGLFNCVDDKERRHSTAVSVAIDSPMVDASETKDVADHVGAMEPFLDSLLELVETLNMNDPTRV